MGNRDRRESSRPPREGCVVFWRMILKVVHPPFGDRVLGFPDGLLPGVPFPNGDGRVASLHRRDESLCSRSNFKPINGIRRGRWKLTVSPGMTCGNGPMVAARRNWPGRPRRGFGTSPRSTPCGSHTSEGLGTGCTRRSCCTHPDGARLVGRRRLPPTLGTQGSVCFGIGRPRPPIPRIGWRHRSGIADFR